MPDININGYPFISQSGTNQPQLTSNVDTKSTFSSLDTSASQGPTTDLTNTTLPIFACRAWVNFTGSTYTNVNGENLCTINASGNISKVVRTALAKYKVYFATSMPDTNYCVNPAVQTQTTNNTNSHTLHAMIDNGSGRGLAIDSVDLIVTRNKTGSEADDNDTDAPLVFVSIFR